MKIKFNLSAGTWEWYFWHKKTFERLSMPSFIELFKTTKITFAVPAEIKRIKGACIRIQRIR